MKQRTDHQTLACFPIARREFLRGAGAMALLIPWRAAHGGAETGIPTIEGIRRATLAYVERMRFSDRPYGRYRYAAEMTEPTLYSSTYAAMTRGLYRDLNALSGAERSQWIAYLQAHQEPDGLYSDPRIAGEGWYKDDPEWCGRRHLSCHVVTALTCLGAVAAKPARWLEPFYDRSGLLRWLENRDWEKNADTVGNEVLNLGTLLQYERDFRREPRAATAVQDMLDWLAHHQINAKTGLWGTFDTSQPKGLSRAVQAAYHFWLLFFYDRRPIPYPRQAVDHVLRTDNPAGSFGWGVHGNTSSACEDIDSIDPLVRMSLLSDYRREEIRTTLRRAAPHILSNQNEDGGFAFIRRTPFSYGHPMLSSSGNGSGLFPTWFRTLSLAYLGKILPDSVAGFDWDFHDCPGYQFWLSPKA
jgi:hypothetical protein